MKKALKWELRYTRENDDKYEKVKFPVTYSGSTFSLIIPKDVHGYSVELVPLVDEGIALCSEFTIAIRKREQLLFNGKVLKWLNEVGEVVPFEDNVAFKVVNSVSRTSKYGSITFNQYRKEFPIGGMNEKGLVIEALWLNENNVSPSQ